MTEERDNDGRRPLERVVSLRPCPFCGGAARLRWSGGDRFAECAECGVQGASAKEPDSETSAERYAELDADAAAKWNRREDEAEKWKARYVWLADAVLYYRSKLERPFAWCVHEFNQPIIYGDDVAVAIDAAIAAEQANAK